MASRPLTGARLIAHVQRDVFDRLPLGVEASTHPVVDGLRRAGAGVLMLPSGDLVHGLDVDVPWRSRIPRVTTIHDLSVYEVPWAFSRARCTAERLLVSRAIRAADTVVAVSAFTADRVRARFGRECEVTPLAPRAAMCPVDEHAVDRVRSRYGLSADTVLCVGTVEPRKRVELLAAACRRVGLPLVLAGSVASGSRIPDGVRHLGYVADGELPALYAAAGAVAYASCYEGFGLPPVEAMACGAAVVATCVGALPDVVGDGARLVPVDDEAALAAGLRDVVRDPDANRFLRSAGQHAMKQLSWAATAAQTLDVYRRLGVPC